jgi:hypothetical protein
MIKRDETIESEIILNGNEDWENQLILLKENLKSSDKHFSINELKEIALRILSESNFDNMEENKIDLHRIDVKHMGKA